MASKIHQTCENKISLIAFFEKSKQSVIFSLFFFHYCFFALFCFCFLIVMIYIILRVVDSGPFAVVHNHWVFFQECLFPSTIWGIPYLSNPHIIFLILTSTSVKGLKSLMRASIHLEDQSLSWLPIMLQVTSHSHTFVYHKSITDKVTQISRRLAKRYHLSCQFRLVG